MGCSNCGVATGKNKLPKGCKNNGNCGTDSCNKLNVFNWLSNMSLPEGQTPFGGVEVRFKNSRKAFFKNTHNLSLVAGDVVVTESLSGYDVGVVSLVGELVKVQMRKRGKDIKKHEFLKIYRKASQKDIDIWKASREKEPEIQVQSRKLAIALNLQMKISDVEFQGDGSKATFYYTAEERIDFRQLIRDMAKSFGIRIEMKQIRYREEAQRLGGIGSCGRELCCSTWLTDFRTVSASAARYQQLALNPQKLAGQCGKFKCCLNYELDTYLEALDDFPSQNTKLSTQKGVAICQKIDIFKKVLWFAYKENAMNWHKLTIKQVKEIMTLNKKHQKASSLEDYAMALEPSKETDFENVAVGQDSLTRFDGPKYKRPLKKNRKSARNA